MVHARIPDYPLSTEERHQLNQILRQCNSPIVHMRAHAILLLFDDHRSFEDVAEIFRVHVNTIRNWADRWINSGIDGLCDLPGRGAKPRFEKWEEELIIEYVEKEPRSLRQVAEKIKRNLGKTVSIETLRRILRKWGKVWKRQRKVSKKQALIEKYEQAKEELEELKQMAAEGDIALIYFDISGFSLTPEVPYAWQDSGRDGTIGIPAAQSKRINVLGFLDPVLNQLNKYIKIGTVNSDFFIEVMDYYCAGIMQPTVVVLDNASIHTSHAVMAKRHEWQLKGLMLYFLPTYSPELNLIEILWRKIKYEWMPISAYRDFETLKNALREILFSFGKEYKIRFS
jgi:transposase